ncbi:nucleolin-like isoform X3 [Boleophthalmus pectinirostris]|uniref:nucleolin-like isoform X3 n=1 Tax=Boleophthalmus pectinirostris TaxID=150288 RepID=UPI000A1C4A84|nr:nucleolin-like isoform X3 [Boleophthalmus pectinirostris]
MAKTNVPKGKTRQSRRLNPGVVEEEGNTTPEQAKDEPEEAKIEVEDKEESEVKNDSTEDKPAEEKPESANTEEVQTEVIPSDVQADAEEPTKEEEIKDEEDAEADAVIEVKGSTPTVSVSWEKKEQQDQEMTEDLIESHTAEISDEGKASTPEEVLDKEPEETPTEEKEDDSEEEETNDTVETEKREDAERETAASENGECGAPKSEEEQVSSEGESEKVKETTDVEMETAASENNECGSPKSEEEQVSSEEESEEVKETTVKGKRKAQPSVDFSPSKKSKLINDGYCVYVGNLNNSKFYEDIKNTLANYFMTHSLLVQDIRLDKAKKHAFVDLASEMDLNKALSLNGEELLDKPLKVAKAKVKEATVKVKDPEQIKQAKKERSIYVENIPLSATREDLVKVFPKLTAVRFLGGMGCASKGVAFVEFQHKSLAKAALKLNKKVKMQERVLRVSPLRDATKSDSTKIEAPPSATLFVRKLPDRVQEKHIKKVFTNAVKINIPQNEGKSKGYAFVEFESVAEAEAALKSSVNSKILKRPFKVAFGLKSKTEEIKVPSKSLVVLGLSEGTSANTLKEAFEGALSSRILMNKSTGLSRKFGFVDFESVESCTAAKEGAGDMEIDGCKVTVAFARPKNSEEANSGEKGTKGEKACSRGKRHGGDQSSQKKRKQAADLK